MRLQGFAATLAALLMLTSSAGAADIWGLNEGSPTLKSASQLAFGPDGILFIGDSMSATILAVDTAEPAGDAAKVNLEVKDAGSVVAKALGSDGVATITDMAVNPRTGSVYLSSGAGVVRIDADGKATALNLENVKYAAATISAAPADKVVGQGRRRGNRRAQTITDMAYVDGKVIVSGLAATDDNLHSAVREFPFPFNDAGVSTEIEIYHGAHGRVEGSSPAAALVPFNIDGEPSLLAGFVCTPLVKFPLKTLQTGKRTRGVTVAELGNYNKPLAMIVYKKDGKNFLLMANTKRGLMKISTDDIERGEGITKPVSGGGVAGQKHEKIAGYDGVTLLAHLNAAHAVVLEKNGNNDVDLKTIELP